MLSRSDILNNNINLVNLFSTVAIASILETKIRMASEMFEMFCGFESSGFKFSLGLRCKAEWL